MQPLSTASRGQVLINDWLPSFEKSDKKIDESRQAIIEDEISMEKSKEKKLY